MQYISSNRNDDGDDYVIYTGSSPQTLKQMRAQNISLNRNDDYDDYVIYTGSYPQTLEEIDILSDFDLFSELDLLFELEDNIYHKRDAQLVNFDFQGNDEVAKKTVKQCVACMTNEVCVKLDCKHISLCMDCTKKTYNVNNYVKCPICRKKSNDVTRIYI